MSAVNISQDLSERIEGHINRLCMGDEVRWDVSLIPTPDQNGNMDLGYLIVMSIKGVLLNTRMVRVLHIPLTNIENDATLGQTVKEVLEDMRKERTTELQSPQAGAGLLVGGSR